MKRFLIGCSLAMLLTSLCYGAWPFGPIIEAVDKSGQQIKTDIMTELGVIKGNSIKLAETMDSLVKVTASMDTKVTAYDKSQHTSNAAGRDQTTTATQINSDKVVIQMLNTYRAIIVLLIMQMVGLVIQMIVLVKYQANLFKDLLLEKEKMITRERESRESKEEKMDTWETKFIESQTARIKELSNGKNKEAV